MQIQLLPHGWRKCPQTYEQNSVKYETGTGALVLIAKIHWPKKNLREFRANDLLYLQPVFLVRLFGLLSSFLKLGLSHWAGLGYWQIHRYRKCNYNFTTPVVLLRSEARIKFPHPLWELQITVSIEPDHRHLFPKCLFKIKQQN